MSINGLNSFSSRVFVLIFVILVLIAGAVDNGAGIGVYWGPGDQRYSFFESTSFILNK